METITIKNYNNLFFIDQSDEFKGEIYLGIYEAGLNDSVNSGKSADMFLNVEQAEQLKTILENFIIYEKQK